MEAQPIISEAASEKPRRGRPPGYASGAEIEFARAMAPDVMTKRGLQDVAFRQRALSLLIKDPAFRWLCDPGPMEAGGPDWKKSWKPGILSALGRIEDDEVLLEAARAVCRARPSTRHAISWLREVRLGRSSPVSVATLTMAVVRAVVGYRRNHPGLTGQDIQAALTNALAALLPDDGGPEPPATPKRQRRPKGE
jgi:hypothetical protein